MGFEQLGIEPGRTVLSAEIGPAKGNLAWAYHVINAAVDGGAQFIKGQLYHRDQLVTKDARSYGTGIAEPATQYEHFADQLSWVEWGKLIDHCRTVGVEPFFSVFDDGAIAFCEEYKIRLYKIASADITYKQLIQKVAATGKPIVLSMGGATMVEVRQALQWIHDVGEREILPLVCTLAYPCPQDQAHLDRIRWWGEHIGPHVGYSDHTRGPEAMVFARDLGALMIEKHFTVEPGAGGDHDFAATPEVFEQYEKLTPYDFPGRVREKLLGSYYMARRTIEDRAVKWARRSVHAAMDIRQGETITEEMVQFLRPGTGIEPADAELLYGLKAVKDFALGEPLTFGKEPVASRGGIRANLTVE